MSVTRGREAAFFFSNYRIRVLRFLYGTLLSAYVTHLPLMCSTNILHPTLPDSSITSSFFLFHYLFSGITMFWLCLKFVAFKFDIRQQEYPNK